MQSHSLESTSRTDLLQLARAADVPGRSSMNKVQLIASLRERDRSVPDEEPGDGDQGGGDQGGGDQWGGGEVKGDGRRRVGSRVEAFRQLAEARARGEMVLLPRMLRGNDRRTHVRETVREDHETRIAAGEVEAREKFDKLARSVFHFFRGTNLLFYRDILGEDARMPTVLALGDVHPGNFGVMPSSDNVPVFGVNDFDDAYYAPFTWDLKRGVVGFMLGAAEKSGLGRKKQRAVAEEFVRGYIHGIAAYVAEGTEQDEQLRQDNAPPMIAELIEHTLRHSRSKWLAETLLGEYGAGFRTDDELVPISSRRPEFQDLVDRYVRENDVAVPSRAGGMRVKDVAERKGAGTASLGLTRYFVLIEGQRADGTDDLLLEFKRARRSALAGLVPPSDFEIDGQGDRIRHAQRVHLVNGDVFYGCVDFDGHSFMVRERAPFRDDISLGSLSAGQWKEYAGICGRVLAHTHAMSDEHGRVDYDVEPAIMDAIGGHDLFVDDLLRFADEAVARVRRDHDYFVADHELGAFRRVDVVYR